MFRLDEVFFYYLKNIIQGDFSERNLTYFSKIITLIYDNIDNIKGYQAINVLVFFKTIKLLNIFMYVDDPMLIEYKKIMIIIIEAIWNHDKLACLSLGRDLVRLLSDTNKDELAFITKDLLILQPNGDTLLDMLLKNVYMKKDSKYFTYSVLIPCKLEQMLETILKSNSVSSNEYRLKWIMKHYKTAESNIQFLFVDIIRFLVQINNQTNPFHLDSKPQIFLWTLNNSENLDLIKSQIKEAIYHDWLFYSESEEFKPIVPGLQFISCLKEPNIIQELLEFILLYAQKFNPAQTEKYRNSIRKCFLVGQQEKLIKIDDVLMRIYLPDIRKDIRQLLDNQNYSGNQVYEVNINTPPPQQTYKKTDLNESDEEIYYQENPSSKTLNRQKFDDDDDDQEMGDGDSSNFYNPSDVHLEVQNTKSQNNNNNMIYNESKSTDPITSNKYKNVRGYDPLNVETPYRFNDTESYSNEPQNLEEIYNPSSIMVAEDSSKEGYNISEIGKTDFEEETIFEEEESDPEPIQQFEDVEVEVLEQAEMHIHQEFYYSFTDEINQLAQNPSSDKLKIFLAEYLRIMTMRGLNINQNMQQSAAVLIYNIFQSHFDDLNIRIQDNICLDIIYFLADCHRRGDEIEYKIAYNLFEELILINDNIISFLIIQLSGQYIQKDKQVILKSLKTIYIHIVSQDNQNLISRIKVDMQEEYAKIFLVIGPKNFQHLIKQVIINSFDVVFLNFFFLKTICQYCSNNYVITDIAPLISKLKIINFTFELNQTLSKAYDMIEYEQQSFWRIYESYLLANTTKPQNVENVIKQIIMFLSNYAVQIGDNPQYWANLNSFFVKFLKQNSNATIMSLFNMDSIQAEKAGYIFKNVDQQLLLSLFRKYIGSETFSPQTIPQLIQNCTIWKKNGIKFNQAGQKEFFEPKLYTKLSQYLIKSPEMKQFQINLATLQVQQQ